MSKQASERPSPLSPRPPPNRTYEGRERQRGIEGGRGAEEEGRAKKGDEVACRDRVAMTTLLEMSRASREGRTRRKIFLPKSQRQNLSGGRLAHEGGDVMNGLM